MNAKLEVSAEQVVAIVRAHLLNQFKLTAVEVGEGKPVVTDDGYEKWELDSISFDLTVPSPL